MSSFTDKALTKISKLSQEEILRVIKSQSKEIQLRSDILDSSDIGYLLVSKTCQVVYYNATIYTLVPCFKNKSTDYSFSYNFPLSKLIKNEEIISFIKYTAEYKTEDDFQYSYDNAEKGISNIRVVSHKFKDTNYMLYSFQNITFFKKIRDEYIKNESLAAMTTMAAGIAHEIKNPLASISIYLQLLQHEFEKSKNINREEVLNNIKIISEEIEHLNTIAVDFLFAVKPIKLNLFLTDINSVVSSSCKLVQAELKASKVKLELNLAASLPKANIDATLIEQCILNLIRNSMQAMTENKKEKLITIQTYLDANNIIISIKDTGCGITEDQMTKIFEPYYTTKADGTGLGLTNIFKIMKMHKGSVIVNSVYGNGAEFSLEIPVPKDQRYRLEN